MLDHPNFGWARGRRTWPEASPAAAEARRRCASPRSVGRIARAASLARALPRRRVARQPQSPKNLSWPTVRVAPSATPSPRARRAQEIAVDEVPTRRSATTREARAPPWRPRAPPGRAFDAAYASAIGRTFVTRAAIVPGGKNARRRTGARDGLPRAVGPFGWSLTLGKDVRHSLERTDRRGRAPAPSNLSLNLGKVAMTADSAATATIFINLFEASIF